MSEQFDKRMPVEAFLQWLSQKYNHPSNKILLQTFDSYYRQTVYVQTAEERVLKETLDKLTQPTYSYYRYGSRKPIYFTLFDIDVSDYTSRHHFNIDLVDPQARFIKSYKMHPLHTDTVSDCLEQLKELIKADPIPEGSLLQWIGRKKKSNTVSQNDETESSSSSDAEVKDTSNQDLSPALYPCIESLSVLTDDNYEDVYLPLDPFNHPLRFVKTNEKSLKPPSFIVPGGERSRMLCEDGVYTRAEV